MDALGRHLPEWRPTEAPGGTSVWLRGPVGSDSTTIAVEAARRGVIIEPGNRFFDKPEGRSRFMRLGFSSIGQQHIEPGIRELAQAAGRMRSAA